MPPSLPQKKFLTRRIFSCVLACRGYLGRPDATRDAITQEGFYKTGDVVVMKNQIIKVVDRKKELIKYKSVSVYLEVEQLLHKIGVEITLNPFILLRLFTCSSSKSPQPSSRAYS